MHVPGQASGLGCEASLVSWIFWSHLDDSDSGLSPLTHPLAEDLDFHLRGTTFPRQIAVSPPSLLLIYAIFSRL